MATMNCVYGYVKLQQADFKFGSTTEKEYTVDCIVEKADAKAWNKKYPKQKAKEFDREDFEKAFKIEAPYEGDEVYVIKLKKPAQYKDGTPIPDSMRPRVFEKGANGKLVDITKDKLVANGSKGVVSYDEVSNDFGTFAKLKAIRVDHLIEYKKAGGGSDYSELGDVESLADDFSDVPERQQSEAQKAVASKQVVAEDPLDEDIPFMRISDKLLMII